MTESAAPVAQAMDEFAGAVELMRHFIKWTHRKKQQYRKLLRRRRRARKMRRGWA